MGTFKSWLIANLEIVYYLLLALIIIGVALFGDFGVEEWGTIVVISLLLLVTSVMSIKHGLAGLLAATIIGASIAYFRMITLFTPQQHKYLLIITIVAAVLGVVVAIYAYSHFDDVVSRRFLYRNSGVSVFEYAWKYAFNRWFACFMLVFGIAFEIMVITNIDQFDLDSVFNSIFSNDTQKTSKELTIPPIETKIKEARKLSLDLSLCSCLIDNSEKPC